MKNLTSILLLLSLCITAYGQNGGEAAQRSERVEILFDLNSHAVDSKYRSNSSSLDHLTELLNQLQNDPQVEITEIKIDSYASPEGDFHYNQRLTQRRTDAIYNYLKTLNVPEELIEKKHSGIDWDGLYAMVEQSDMAQRKQVL